MRFALTVLLVGILYIRPWELVEGWENAQVYLAVILACMVCSALPLLRQLKPNAIAARPITFCVLGLLASVILSHLARAEVGAAVGWGFLVFKLVVLYLLLVGNLDSVARLRLFLGCLGALILGVTVLVLLQYHKAINIPALAVHETWEYDPRTGTMMPPLPRVCGPGIFHDPNDLCVTLVIGLIICLYWLGERRLGALRFAWLVPFGVMGYAVSLTHSRGGFIALACGLFALFQARWGWKKGVLLGLVAAPVLLLALGGRQTNFDLDSKDDTSQIRIRIWSDGLVLLRDSPLFGIGQGRFVDAVGITAHNSYIEVYTQTGLIGGTFFLGAFVYGAWALTRLQRAHNLEPGLQRLRPYLLAILATLAGGMLSLSRDATPPTYVTFGLVAAYLQLAPSSCRALIPGLSLGLAGRMAAISVAAILLLHTFTVLVVRR